MKEYGGYLPLEIAQKSCYYCEKEGMSVKELNSGKAAIYYALKAAEVKKVYIPFYICSSVVEIAYRANVEVERYFINCDFMPVGVELKDEKEIILIVNYFGITYEKIKEIISNYSQVIIDNTQAFFADPILKKGIYNVYSCKKFIGVPDGGYLIAKELCDIPMEKDYSSEHMDFCLESIEYGTGYSYEKKKENDKRFLNEIKEMSLITHKLLQSVDYSLIKKRRMGNFNVLHEKLRQYNRLELNELEFVPYYYPLFLEKGIQSELVAEKVYTPILWRELIDDIYIGRIEKEFSENIVFLPLDQRYTEVDMLEIIRRIKNILNH